MEDDYKIANYNPEHVKNEYLDIFHTTSVGNANLLLSAFRWKTFKSAIIGVTWKPVICFLILYYIFQILYQYQQFSTCHIDGPDAVPEAEAAECNRAWHDWVAGMKENTLSSVSMSAR